MLENINELNVNDNIHNKEQQYEWYKYAKNILLPRLNRIDVNTEMLQTALTEYETRNGIS